MFVIRDRWISEFEASLIYRVSSRTARATQRNSVSRNQKKKKKTKKKKKVCYIAQVGLELYMELQLPLNSQ
jgi:hypothetical protein